MPVEEQQALLLLAGATLQQKNNLACNPLGGVESCMTLPADSRFAELCPGHDLKVDCAYYSDDLLEVNLDPGSELKQLLEARGLQGLQDSCPQCFQNQQKLWCAQTVPRCGSYQENLVGLLLPALAQAITAQESGQTQHEALSSVMPPLLKAASLSLPCREMCKAVTTTCACGQERSLGGLLDKVMDGLLPDQELPEDFSQQVFGSLYDQPLCSLYSPGDAQGFTGPCDLLPASCTHNSTWCNGGTNPDSEAVEELMALQLTKAMFVWVGSHTSGLFADGMELIDDADSSGERSIEDKYTGHSSEGISHKFVLTLGVIGGLVALVLTAGMASVVFKSRFEDFPQNLRGVFQRRRTTNDANYQELEPTSEREPLVP
ncbi:hypothetical protein ABBQ38_008919 [Trebouxia sp. C0009 RCD-2024]